MSDMDEAKEVSADICHLLYDKKVPAHIGTGAMALVIGSMAAHTDDPADYMKNIMALAQAVIDYKQKQNAKTYN